ncbi:MAG TPA: hypothetical protein VIH59_00415 [Candidatus Tectomicrobia bacterium]
MLCAVMAHGGGSACLVGGGTIRSDSPAVNSKPDAARMDRRYAARQLASHNPAVRALELRGYMSGDSVGLWGVR